MYDQRSGQRRATTKYSTPHAHRDKSRGLPTYTYLPTRAHDGGALGELVLPVLVWLSVTSNLCGIQIGPPAPTRFLCPTIHRLLYAVCVYCIRPACNAHKRAVIVKWVEPVDVINSIQFLCGSTGGHYPRRRRTARC